MDKEQLVKQIMERGKDYGQQMYFAGFFVVFVFFIVFIIRPSINDYVVRQTQLDETKQMVAEYQKVIENLTKLQTVLEVHRDDFILLEKAIPMDTGLYQLARDIEPILPYMPSRSYAFSGYALANTKAPVVPAAGPKSFPLSLSLIHI